MGDEGSKHFSSSAPSAFRHSTAYSISVLLSCFIFFLLSSFLLFVLVVVDFSNHLPSEHNILGVVHISAQMSMVFRISASVYYPSIFIASVKWKINFFYGSFWRRGWKRTKEKDHTNGLSAEKEIKQKRAEKKKHKSRILNMH